MPAKTGIFYWISIFGGWQLVAGCWWLATDLFFR